MFDSLDELIEILQEVSDMGYGNCKVRMAHQYNWPLSERPSAVSIGAKEDDAETMVYIACDPISDYSDESPYAPRWAWEGGVKGEDFDSDGDYDY